MTLSLYAQYAAVTAIFVLMVITIALAIKSWFDEATFTSNLMLTRQFNRMDQQQMLKALSEDDFDDHVNSTPGMQTFLHTLN